SCTLTWTQNPHDTPLRSNASCSTFAATLSCYKHFAAESRCKSATAIHFEGRIQLLPHKNFVRRQQQQQAATGCNQHLLQRVSASCSTIVPQIRCWTYLLRGKSVAAAVSCY